MGGCRTEYTDYINARRTYDRARASIEQNVREYLSRVYANNVSFIWSQGQCTCYSHYFVGKEARQYIYSTYGVTVLNETDPCKVEAVS